MGTWVLRKGDHCAALTDVIPRSTSNAAPEVVVEEGLLESKHKVKTLLTKYFQTVPELRRKRLAEYYLPPQGSKEKKHHQPIFLIGDKRLRCSLCCSYCFTTGTATNGPEVIDRADFHKQVNMGDAMCNVCKAPLCFKKTRFPGQTKTCWEIFHTQKAKGSVVW
jgi:hypothetical protein